jgi:hypothetical protein
LTEKPGGSWKVEPEISVGGSVVLSPVIELSMTQKPLKPPGLFIAIMPVIMAMIRESVSASFLITYSDLWLLDQ